jgi:hypothetical protein
MENLFKALPCFIFRFLRRPQLLRKEDWGHDQSVDGRSDSSGRRGGSVEEGRKADGVAALRPGRDDGIDYGGARERVLGLAGTADRQDRAGRGSGSQSPEAVNDRSLAAIKKQIAALDVERFEVGLREAKTGLMMNRQWSRAEVEQSAAWLKRMNAKGNDVYIRPAGDHGLILVDDLKADKISSMAKDGFTSAATIETSPGNYQVWVKISDKPLSVEARRLGARSLAKHYSGDMNSADGQHYGRLAGFTNQKPEHARAGRQPFVLARECSGSLAAAAPSFTARIEQHIDKAEAKEERAVRLKAIKTAPGGVIGSNPVRYYQHGAKRLLARYGDSTDLSRLDWMVGGDMAAAGFSAKQIEQVILDHSPQVESRKAGHVEDYARRTVQKLFADPDVIAKRDLNAAQERQRGRDRGSDYDMPGR